MAAQPVFSNSGAKGGDEVFEDFPLPERRHWRNQAHAAQKESLDKGFMPLKAERDAERFGFHIGRRLPDDHPEAVGGGASHSPGGSEALTTTYQALVSGNATQDSLDGVGRPPPRRGKKMVQSPGAQSSVGRLLITEMKAGKGALRLGGDLREFGRQVQDPKTRTARGGHIPGYSGFVPVTAEANDEVRVRDLDKSLTMQNYNGHMVGYTGRRPMRS